MERLSFDTTFLIDLQREKIREPGPAHVFLSQNPEAIPCLSLTALGEFAEGFPSPRDPACLLVVDSFDHLPMDRQTAEVHSRVSRELRTAGNRIGSNDLWIASPRSLWRCLAGKFASAKAEQYTSNSSQTILAHSFFSQGRTNTRPNPTAGG